jgi:hypothetical protein
VTGYETGTGGKIIKRRIIILHVILIVFPLVAAVSLQADSPATERQSDLHTPEIYGNKITFSNGTVINYTPNKNLAPEDEDWKNPTWHSSTIQKPYLIPQWERLLLVTREFYYEGDQLILELYDFSGNRAGTVKELHDGRELVVEHAGRIAVVMLGPDTVNQCAIFDADGANVWSKKYDDIITNYGQTEDEELWWVALLSGEINVFNNDGKLISEEQNIKGRPNNIQYLGKEYKIYGDTN